MASQLIPTMAGFLLFVRDQLEVSETDLPDDSPTINLAYDVATNTVLCALSQLPGPIYMLAVYNLGASVLIHYAPDVPPSDFWKDVRKKWNIHGYVSGTVSSSSDVSTSQTLVVPEVAKEFTLEDLELTKDPWGRAYLATAQKYGPAIWGLN